MTNKELLYDYLSKFYNKDVDSLIDKGELPVIDEVFLSWCQRVVGSPKYEYSIFQNKRLDNLADYGYSYSDRITDDDITQDIYCWLDSLYFPKFTLYKNSYIVESERPGSTPGSLKYNIATAFESKTHFSNDANAYGFYYRKNNKIKLMTNGYRGYYIINSISGNDSKYLNIPDNATEETLKSLFDAYLNLVTVKMKHKYDLVAKAKGAENTTKVFENRPLLAERTSDKTYITQRRSYLDIDIEEINNRIFTKRINQYQVGASKNMLYIKDLAPAKINTPSRMTETQRADLVNTITNIGPQLDYGYDCNNYIHKDSYNIMEIFVNERFDIKDEPYDLAKLLAGEAKKIIKEGLDNNGYKKGGE